MWEQERRHRIASEDARRTLDEAARKDRREREEAERNERPEREDRQ